MKKLMIVATVVLEENLFQDKEGENFFMDEVIQNKTDGIALIDGMIGQIGYIDKVYFKKLFGDFDEFLVVNRDVPAIDGIIVTEIIHTDDTRNASKVIS
jgi:hypothetical protein